MWIVQLQYHGFAPWTKVVCGCDSEEAAFAAGKIVADYYNHPDYGLCDSMAGVVTFNMILYYSYAVKYHEGEWING